jgi:hypothetical protein
MFLDMDDNIQMFPELKDENWKANLAFLVGVPVLEHLNNLNVILQAG